MPSVKFLTLYRRMRLFLFLLWREVEPRSMGIPDPYRAVGRYGIRLAWTVASLVHPFEIRAKRNLGRLMVNNNKETT